ESARQLVKEKDRLRRMERELSERHFERLRQGSEQSIETSSIHLDTIRDLKQVNSLLAALAYPVLEEAGQLGASRLKTPEHAITAPAGAGFAAGQAWGGQFRQRRCLHYSSGS